MRILVASDHWFPDHRGGAARVAAETAALLAARGHAVEALAPAAADLPAHERRDGVVVRRVLPRTRVPQTLADPWRTGRAARGLEADLALAHTSTTATGLALARPDLPLVVVYHASAPREARFERSRLPRGRRRAAVALREPVLQVLDRWALARAARIVVLSEFSRGLLESDHPTVLPRVRVAHGGVDTHVFSPGDRDAARARVGARRDRRLLLTVRRLAPRMGLERLLEAFAALAPERPELELAIVGDGPLRAELESLRRRLGLERSVTLAGRVDDDTLLDWYRAADLFVLPTLAYEGFGLVTAEALACGVPVVGTPAGATPELLRPLDERLLARSTSAADLAAAIAGGLELATPELRGRCRQHAERRLSWAAVLPEWEQALAGLPDLRPAEPAVSRGVGHRSAGLRSRT